MSKKPPLKHHTNDTAAKQKTTADNNLRKQKRRMLLKGTAAVLPVILTLHSGAALARTSNLVGPAAPGDDIAKQNLGDGRGDRVICMHPNPAKAEQELGGEAPPYDLGPAPSAHLEHNTNPDSEPITEIEQAINCEMNHGGIAVSATAFTSIMTKSGVSIDTTW